jgi:stress response protein YsnF
MPRKTKQTIPIAEERVALGKRKAHTGKVTVQTTVEEREEIVRGEVVVEDVEVERIRLDREVDAMPSPRVEGDTTIIPIVEEVLIVEKRLVLREEIHVRKRRSTEAVEVPVKLRKVRADIETGAEGLKTKTARRKRAQAAKTS